MLGVQQLLRSLLAVMLASLSLRKCSKRGFTCLQVLTLYLHTQNGLTNAQLGNNLKGVLSLLFTNNTAQIEAASDSMGVPLHFLWRH